MTLTAGHYLRILGKGCEITLQPRQPYCDRGNLDAKVFPREGAKPEDVPHIYGADMWPRYYFDLDRAKAECEAWLKKRKQLINRQWSQHDT